MIARLNPNRRRSGRAFRVTNFRQQTHVKDSLTRPS